MFANPVKTGLSFTQLTGSWCAFDALLCKLFTKAITFLICTLQPNREGELITFGSQVFIAEAFENNATPTLCVSLS